jgi:hypothetical protein
MSRGNRRPLEERVAEAAEAAFAAQKYVSPLDVLLGIGWLDPNSARRWRLGQAECLESVMQVDQARVADAMRLLATWAQDKGLVATGAEYVARTPAQPPLRFSHDGDETTERRYRFHWIAGDLSEKQRQRLRAKASRPAELVVIEPLNRHWACHRCGGSEGLLIMESAGPACLACAGLGDLEFLGAGNALLTRRAKAKSARHAVVVRFSKARRRYERQGVLVEPQALHAAEREIAEEGRG